MPEYGDPELQAEMDEAPVTSNARDWVVKTGDQWDEKGAEEEGVTIDVHPCNRPAKAQHLPRNYKDMDALGWFHLIWEREEWDKLPYIDMAPVAKKLLVGVVLTSTRTGGRKEYKKKAQS
eukprot:jgi/Mesvir1/3445/Mv11940-RA.1